MMMLELQDNHMQEYMPSRITLDLLSVGVWEVTVYAGRKISGTLIVGDMRLLCR